MKNTLLLPNRYKVYGWAVFLVTVIIFLTAYKFKWQPAFLTINAKEGGIMSETNILKEIIFSFWMVSLILICFSREKKEDEYLSYLRLQSWQLSVLISLVVSLVGTWSIWSFDYLVFAGLNMLTVPIVFIIKFNINLYQLRRGGNHEK